MDNDTNKLQKTHTLKMKQGIILFLVFLAFVGVVVITQQIVRRSTTPKQSAAGNCSMRFTVGNQNDGSFVYNFQTPYVSIKSQEMRVKINGVSYVVPTSGVGVVGHEELWRLHTDPRIRVVELTWNDNGKDMRLAFTFRYVPGSMWELTKIMVYDHNRENSSLSKWVSIESFSEEQKLMAELGGMTIRDASTTWISGDATVEVFMRGYEVNGFIPVSFLPPSEQGYVLTTSSFSPLLMQTSTHGYGVNALLRDGQLDLIQNQTPFEYLWSSDDEQVARVIAQSGSSCITYMTGTCTGVNASIEPVSPGVTNITVRARRKSDAVVVAEAKLFVQVTGPASTPLVTQPPQYSDTMRLTLALTSAVQSHAEIRGRMEIGILGQTEPIFSQDVQLLRIGANVFSSLIGVPQSVFSGGQKWVSFKGEKHLRRVMGPVSLYPAVVVNMDSKPIVVGDLPAQDGVADLQDLNKILSVLGNSTRTQQDIFNADLNYDGVVNAIDVSLMLGTLSYRPDEATP